MSETPRTTVAGPGGVPDSSTSSGPFLSGNTWTPPKFEDPFDPPTPGPPRNVRVTYDGTLGTIIVEWQDYPFTSSRARTLGLTWSVRYCPATVAGPQSSTPTWASNVLLRSIEISTRPVAYRAEVFRVNYSNTTLKNGWIIVVARASGDVLGEPSIPVFVDFRNAIAATPDNPGSTAIFARTSIRDPYDNLQIQFAYFKPADDSKGFAGVHMHMTGWNGSAVVQEIGAMHRYDGSNGGQLFTLQLPLELGQGNGVAHFTNASTSVTRVSGDNFAAAWASERLLILPTNKAVYPVFSVAGVVPTTSLTLNANFVGTTGDYPYKVLNLITFYFVSVGLNGSRVADYSTAPSAIL